MMDILGTDFDRSAFREMMEKVKAGEINCIIVEDKTGLCQTLC